MSGKLEAPIGRPLAVVVAEVLGDLQCEARIHEEMHGIRLRHRAGGATGAELLRYRSLWVALSLRRTTCNRAELSDDVTEAVARYRSARTALLVERARAAVDAAFEPEDGAAIGEVTPQPH